MLKELVVTSIVIATTFALTMLIGPIVQVAIRTGRWLGQGVVYDKSENPIKYRAALWSFTLLIALFMFLSVWLSSAFYAKFIR
jgi:hypothetical protein